MPHAARDQAERREELYGLLRAGAVRTQRALVAALKARGIAATQSSVSRDLKEIGAVKTPDGYVLTSDRTAGSDHEFATVADLVRELKTAGPNLLVIGTGVGAAQRVALALDRAAWPEIVGCIGGDDTVFVATAGLTAQKQLVNRIEQSLGPVEP